MLACVRAKKFRSIPGPAVSVTLPYMVILPADTGNAPSEILKQFLKRPALRARLVEQALPDGGADVASAHRTASRYGRITFWTRSICANFVRAALFGLGVRSRYARRASIATSSPILLRYLKQSVIVFSGE